MSPHLGDEGQNHKGREKDGKPHVHPHAIAFQLELERSAAIVPSQEVKIPENNCHHCGDCIHKEGKPELGLELTEGKQSQNLHSEDESKNANRNVQHDNMEIAQPEKPIIQH